MRPVLVLPRGIAEQLSAEQLDAIMAHELSHMRRRDNLTAALHMLVEAVFWFHPLVWWLETRLVEERERACDEAVLESRRQPVAYAEAILNVCKFYVGVPLSCVSGVMGSHLKTRIARILSGQAARKLDLRRKALLSLTGVSDARSAAGAGHCSWHHGCIAGCGAGANHHRHVAGNSPCTRRPRSAIRAEDC